MRLDHGEFVISPTVFILTDRKLIHLPRMGFVLSEMNLGALVGPFVAGLLYENVGYYAVFAFVLGVLFFDTILLLTIIEKRTAVRWIEEIKSPDPISNEETHLPRDISSNYDYVTFPRGSIDSSVTGDQPHEPNSSSNELSTLLANAPPRSQSWFRSTFPAMSVLLSSPRLMTAVYGCFTHTTLTAAFDAILPLFVKRTFGWGSTGAGCIFLAITIPSVIGPIVGSSADRYGTKRVALLGFMVASPFLALLGLVTGSEPFYQALLIILLIFTSQYLYPFYYTSLPPTRTIISDFGLQSISLTLSSRRWT